MRPLLTASLLTLAASCTHPTPAAVVATPIVAPPADASPPPPARVVRHREPEAAPPAEFATNADPVDVDHDGRPDLAVRWPTLPTIGDSRVNFLDVPPAVVAHRLDDGRYAVDDDVARAALRGACPAPPGATSPHAEEGEAPNEQLRVAHAQMLFLEGFCRRVWGASAEDAVAAVRASASGASRGLFEDSMVRAVVEALQRYPVPQELEALQSAEPIALVPDAPQAQPEPTPAATPPDARCAAVLRANTAVRTRASAAAATLRGDDTVRVQIADMPTCVATPRGVWSVQYKTFTLTRGGDPSLTLRAEVVWQPTTGPALRATPFSMRFTPFSWDTLSLRATTDYDGDGVPEVFVRADGDVMEGAGTLSLVPYTVHGGAVARYEAGARFESITDVLDADGDGRDDLVLRSPWSVLDSCGLEGITHNGPSSLAHSLPDGTFSIRDDVARAWSLRGCVRDLHQDGEPYADVIDIACARIRGASADGAVASLARRWPAAPQVYVAERGTNLCLAFPSVAALALVAPPFEPVRDPSTLPRLTAAR